MIGDSSFIIDYLKATYGDRLGENTLKPEERAIALSMRRMVEEHLYWVIVYSYWMEDAVWEEYKPVDVWLHWRLPKSRRIGKMFAGNCTGRGWDATPDRRCTNWGMQIFRRCRSICGDKPYALGERPTELDATVYAFLARILWCPYESPLKTHARTLPNLEAYCQRMHTQYYSSRN